MRRVLIADDSAVARFSVARKVRAASCDAIEVDCAAAASAIDPQGLACALLDLDLGDGDGVDVATALRVRRADLPIAFFSSTAHARPDAEAIGRVFAKPAELDLAVAWVLAQ